MSLHIAVSQIGPVLHNLPLRYHEERSLRTRPAARAGQQGAAATGARRSNEATQQYLVKNTEDNRTADIL